MINPITLHTDILTGIMQNIIPVNIPVTGADNSSANVTATSFSETLAQRLAEIEYPNEYEFRRIINEEIVASIDIRSLHGFGRTNLSSGMNAVLGMADPFDTLRFYGSLLGLRQNNNRLLF